MTNRNWGLAFPLNLKDGINEHPTLKESIDSSLSLILAWHFNSRNFLNKFGSILYLSLGKPHSKVLRTTIILYTKRAIKTWETRLVNIRIEVDFGEDWLNLVITGTIKENQQFYNYSAIL